VLGPEHPNTAQSLNNVAYLLHAQGDVAGARPLKERALAIYEKALGPEHPDTATSLNDLAGVLQAQGDYAGARPLYERALAIREKVLGPEHPNMATSMSNLARLLTDTGHVNEAEPLFLKAIAIGGKARNPRLRPMRRPLAGITCGQRTAPSSPPPRSMRLAAQRRRRRCGSGMGSPGKANEMTALAETSQRIKSSSPFIMSLSELPSMLNVSEVVALLSVQNPREPASEIALVNVPNLSAGRLSVGDLV
jgi:tetratricopeptide (TPR) repeat protein